MAILLYEGTQYDCILSDYAAEQVGMSSEDDDFPDTLFGHDTDELINRITRYCDNPGDLVLTLNSIAKASLGLLLKLSDQVAFVPILGILRQILVK